MQKSVATREIKAAALFRVYDKSGKFIGYAVPSDQGGSVPYLVTYNRETGRYACQCRDHQERDHDCKHIRAAVAVAIARHEFHKQPVSTPVASASFSIHVEVDKVVAQAEADHAIGDHYELVGAMYQALGSCNICGYPVKPGFVTCSKCLGC